MSQIATKWIEDEAVTKEKVNQDVAGNGLEKTATGNPLNAKADAAVVAGTANAIVVTATGIGILVDGLSIKDQVGTIQLHPRTAGAAGLAAVLDIAAGGEGVSVKVDSNTVKENGSSQLEVHLSTTPAANQAASLGADANGVYIKVDDDTVKEDGSNQLFVNKDLASYTQVNGFSPSGANYDDIDAEVDAAAVGNNTPRDDFVSGPGVYVDAIGNYSGGTALPLPVQVTEFGKSGCLILRDSLTKDPLVDPNENEIYGVTFYDTSNSKFYVRYFSDILDVQTPIDLSVYETVDFKFVEIDTFANLPVDALLGMLSNFIDIVTGDITQVNAGDGLVGGGSSGIVTLDVVGGPGLTVNANNIQVNPADLIHDGTAEIDGDIIDITYVPTNYTRDTSPAQVTSVEELTAHLAGIDNALSAALGVEIMHKVTAGEVAAGFLTLPSYPVNQSLVRVTPVKGPAQVNKQNVGATGATPDYDVLGTNNEELHINNNGAATGLSGDIKANDILIIEYPTAI